MSRENLEQFMNQIAGSEELQAKIGEEIDAEALIALGAECGCEFTAEELQDSAELSDEELDGVAGGAVKRGVRPTVTAIWQIPDMPRHDGSCFGCGLIMQYTRGGNGRRFKVNFHGVVFEDDLV